VKARESARWKFHRIKFFGLLVVLELTSNVVAFAIVFFKNSVLMRFEAGGSEFSL